jgi:hypothetical protein
VDGITRLPLPFAGRLAVVSLSQVAAADAPARGGTSAAADRAQTRREIWNPKVGATFSPFQEIYYGNGSLAARERRSVAKSLADVLAACGPAGKHDAALVSGAASNWIMEAYDQGVRDQATLVQYALQALRDARVTAMDPLLSGG